MLIHASARSAAPAAYPKAPYDTAKDFAAVAVFGVEPMVLSPAEFDALIRKEIAINLSIVKAANLKFD